MLEVGTWRQCHQTCNSNGFARLPSNHGLLQKVTPTSGAWGAHDGDRGHALYRAGTESK